MCLIQRYVFEIDGCEDVTYEHLERVEDPVLEKLKKMWHAGNYLCMSAKCEKRCALSCLDASLYRSLSGKILWLREVNMKKIWYCEWERLKVIWDVAWYHLTSFLTQLMWKQMKFTVNKGSQPSMNKLLSFGKISKGLQVENNLCKRKFSFIGFLFPWPFFCLGFVGVGCFGFREMVNESLSQRKWEFWKNGNSGELLPINNSLIICKTAYYYP